MFLFHDIANLLRVAEKADSAWEIEYNILYNENGSDIPF